MGEMTKTSTKYCRKCKYSWKHSDTDIICGYIVATQMRRGCICFFDTAEYCRTGKYKGVSVKITDLVR